MNSVIAAPPASPAPTAWADANRAYLDLRARELRLLLRRRVLWLRKQWGRDPLQGYHGLVITDAEADILLVSGADDRAAEARFRRQDREARALSGHLVAVRREIEALLASMPDAPPALDLLARHFQLTPFEQDVLFLCLAPELDPAFERLYAYVQDDATRKYATPHLALALFDERLDDPREGRDSFLPDGPLRRYRLLTLEPASLPAATPGTRPLRLDERIGDYLLGVSRLDERLAQLLRPLSPGVLTEQETEIATGLAAQASSRIGQGRRPLLNLVGPDGGLGSVGAAVCEALGHHLLALDPAGLPPPGPERTELLRLIERDALLSHLAIYLDATRIAGEADQPLAAALGEVAERLGALVVVGSREPWRSERDVLHAIVPRPDTAAQRSLWRRTLLDALGGDLAASLDGAIQGIVQQFDLTAPTIARAVAVARDRAARVAGNTVVAPGTLALHLTGRGPMQVTDNRFTTHGVVGLPIDFAPTLVELLGTLTSITPVLVAALLQPSQLVGAVFIANLGQPPVFQQLSQAKGYTTVQVDASWSTAGVGMAELSGPGGAVQFSDNQVMLSMRTEPPTLLLMGTGIATLDDLVMAANQTTNDLNQSLELFDALALATTARVTANGYAESLTRCLYSLVSQAWLASTGTDNHGTHCIAILGNPARTIDRDNIALACVFGGHAALVGGGGP